MGLYLATGRSQLTNSDWTITTTANDGNLTAKSYYFSIQARNRVGRNLPLYSDQITTNTNDSISFTINSSALKNGEGWISYIISVNSINSVFTYSQIAEIPIVNLDTNTSNSLPLTLKLINNEQLAQSKIITNTSELPSTLAVHGMLRGLQSTGLIYKYDLFDSTSTVNNTSILLGYNNRRWKQVGTFLTYLNNVTGADGCSQDLREITDFSNVIVPKYNSNGSDSPGIQFWLTNSNVIEANTLVQLDVKLGSVNKSNLFSKKLKVIFKGYVNLLTGIKRTVFSNNTSVNFSTVDIDYDYDAQNPVLKLEDDLQVNEAYVLEVKLNFSAVELNDLISNGSFISILPYFTLSSSTYNSVGTILGNLILKESDQRRIIPNTALTLTALKGSGLIKNYSFPVLPEQLISQVLPSTDNQKVVINKEGICYIATNIPSDAVLRAVVGSIAGEVTTSAWSSYASVAANKALTVTLTYPCTSTGLGTIRGNYPDVIAGNNKGYFNPFQVNIYIQRQSDLVIKKFTFTVVPGTTQVFTITDFNGTVVTNTNVNSDTRFGLYTTTSRSFTSATTGTFTADSYRIADSLVYNGNQITKISHDSTILSAIDSNYATEIDLNFSELFDRIKYVAQPITDITTLKTLVSTNITNYQSRYVINNNSNYRYNPTSTLTNDDIYVIKPNDVLTSNPGRWLSSNTNTIFNGSGVPSSTLGNINDYYLNLANGDYYQKTTSIVWTLISNIKGIQGTVWYTGSTVPNNSSGLISDYYLNATNGDYYLKGSSTWTLQGNLRGLQGIQGNPGNLWYSGSTVPSSGLGVNGDLYLKIDTSDLYQKSSGTWAIITNIKGATGASGSIAGSISGITFDYTTTAPTTTSTQGGIWNNNGIFKFRNISNGSDNTFAYIDKQQSYTKPQTITPQTLTYAATIAIDASLTEIFRLTLTGNAIISNATNLVDGTTYLFWIIQDSTGSRIITWGTNYDFGVLGTPTLTTTANKKDLLSFISDGTKLYFLGIAKTYS